jgi:UDP-N-acetylglucosamine pyrophosphorylase
MTSHRTQRGFATVILAAGKGTRMKDPETAKVMQDVCSKPMLHYVVGLAEALHAEPIVAVVGHKREVVMEYLGVHFPRVQSVVQEPQLGTGHAVLQAQELLRDFSGDVLVLSGDVPLLQKETLLEFIGLHHSSGAVASILTARLDDPAAYGRIVRNADGSVRKIVERRDATPQEAAIREINSGIYVFEKERLFDALTHIDPHNAQQEYYLTDVFEYFWGRHLKVSALISHDPREILGVNTTEELERVREVMSARLRAETL